MSKTNDQWNSGFLCAVAAMADYEGIGSTMVEDLLRQILPLGDWADEYDRQKLEDYGYLKSTIPETPKDE